MDALLLGQELQDIANVVTIGSASRTPNGAILEAFRAASVVFLALDGDVKGCKTAGQWRTLDGWPEQTVRILPPRGKDWGESHEGGVYLRGFWQDVIRGAQADDRPAIAAPATPYDALDWRDGGIDRPF